MTRKAKRVLDQESGKFLTAGEIKRQRKHERDWDIMYERLKAFYKARGHSNVIRSDPDKALSGWVHGQRNRYSTGKRYLWKHGPFTAASLVRCQSSQTILLTLAFLNRLLLTGSIAPYQVKLLEDIGFEFVLGREYHKHRVEQSETFKARMEQLRKFKDTHGHVRVPKVYRANPSLSWWYHQLRARRRNGFLASGEIAALDEIGFEWETTKSRRAEQLKSEREAAANQLSRMSKKKKAPTRILSAVVPPKRRLPMALRSIRAADDRKAAASASPASSPAKSKACRVHSRGRSTAVIATSSSTSRAQGRGHNKDGVCNDDDDDGSSSVAIAQVVDEGEEASKYTRVDYEGDTSPDHSSKIVVASLVWDSALSQPDDDSRP
jgi:hypothetical protein